MFSGLYVCKGGATARDFTPISLALCLIVSMASSTCGTVTAGLPGYREDHLQINTYIDK